MLFLLLACRDLPVDTSLSTDTDTDTDTGCTRSVQVWSDQDGDGWGTGEPVDVCFQEEGQALQSGDCDDDDPDSFPGAPEIPLDAVDQDCDGVDSRDGDGDGEDVDTDCDDADPARSTLFDEICDTEVDENCDGVVDEDCQYFGGVASTEAVLRIEGKRTGEWANLSRTGYQVFYAGTPSQNGPAMLGVWGETYSGDTVHIFEVDAATEGVVDLSDAYVSLAGYDEFLDTRSVSFWSRGGVSGLVAQTESRTWFFEEPFGSLSTDDAVNPTGAYSSESISASFSYREGSEYPSMIAMSNKDVRAFDLGEMETYPDALFWSASFDSPTSPAWVSANDWNGDGYGDILMAVAADSSTELKYAGDGTLYYETGPLVEAAIGVVDLNGIGSWQSGMGPSDAPIETYPGNETFHKDLNSDGYPELILTQKRDGVTTVYVWYSLTDLDLSGPDLLLFTNETKAFGDMNGDGNLDLATGGKTTVDLLLGPLGTGVVDVAEEAQGHLVVSEDEVMWSDVVFVDDIDGDGCDELLVGDPNYQTEPDLFGPGAAFLYLGALGSP
jgi:hypothetical protein